MVEEKIGGMTMLELFDWLEGLKKLGIVNMFAAPQVMADSFEGITMDQAKKVFTKWTEWHNQKMGDR